MLPAAIARRPDASSIAAINEVTVVLPLVPGDRDDRRVDALRRELDLAPNRYAMRSRGDERGMVGRNARARDDQIEPGDERVPAAARRPSSTVAPDARDVGAARVLGTRRVLLDDGDLDALAPQHRRRLLPRLRQPEHEHAVGLRDGSLVHAREPQEVGVEEAEAHRRAQPGEQPEPHGHRELGPATDLEVMVDRRHAQDPAAEAAERDHLRDHRQRLDHVEAAENRQQQLVRA